jgi:HEAT repeat protein
VDEIDLNIIYTFLKSLDVETKMDGLKALRGLNATQAVPEILPLLNDENPHVLRDACRTLAVLGNTNTIPFIEPLLKNPRYDVKGDAQAAINILRAKK